jgi:hypothetical protein
MLRLAYIRGIHIICLLVCTYSHAFQEQKSHLNKSKCNVVPRPEFHDLSNGAIFFAMRLILCTGKWEWIEFAETVLVLNRHFQHIWLSLQENQVQHSKERNIFVYT